MLSRTGGGLNFLTSAASFVPFESITVIFGNVATFAVASAWSLAWRRICSSTSGRRPRMSPRSRSTGSTHACSIAFFFSSCVTQGRGR